MVGVIATDIRILRIKENPHRVLWAVCFTGLACCGWLLGLLIAKREIRKKENDHG
jgi:hypothetical protein